MTSRSEGKGVHITATCDVEEEGLMVVWRHKLAPAGWHSGQPNSRCQLAVFGRTSRPRNISENCA